MTGTNLNAMLQAYDYAVILSAELEYMSTSDNAEANTNLEAHIKQIGLKYYPVQGMYKGSEEQSFLVFCNDYYDVSRMEVLALYTYTQESILVLDLLKECALLKYDDRVSNIGRGLVEVDKETAINMASYSIIDNNYWIVE